MGLRVHLAHPQGNDWGMRRVKNDERDARDLADLLRLDRLAEAWIAPPEVRELREMVRFRAKLSNLAVAARAVPRTGSPLAHLDRVDNQIALLTIGTGTEDRGLGPNE
jgi:hypothetical protein